MITIQENVDFYNEWGANLVVVKDQDGNEYAVKREYKENTLDIYFNGLMNVKNGKLVDTDGNVLPYWSYGADMKVIYKYLYEFVKITNADACPSYAKYKGIWKSSYYAI